MGQQGEGEYRVSLEVEGMSSRSSVQAVEKALTEVEGTERAMVDLDTGRAHVEGTARPVALVGALEKAGYTVVSRPSCRSSGLPQEATDFRGL